MNAINKRKESGFTIIEVVLVLAIAGLIFLIVFLALPQLQASRRDTQRRSDAGRIAGALESYAGNNNGSYNGYQVSNLVADGYLDAADTVDPSTGAPYPDNIQYPQPRQYIVCVDLEGVGGLDGADDYCVDNI
jgi:prepilin-type N-terminal cleavage/methylation domain-containing protein